MYEKALTIDELNNKINHLVYLRDILQKVIEEPVETEKQEMAHMYIQFQSLVFVADYVNSKGLRIETKGYGNCCRKYISNDIRDIINDSNNKENVFVVARLLYKFNKGEYKIQALISRLKKLEI